MANPQKENGYTPIANEILEALMKINLSSYQSRLLFAVWRKTYGFGKPDDWISNSQLVDLTGLKKQHVSRAKKQLIDRKILVTHTGYKIQFNKDYSQWGELPKSVTVTNRGNGVTNRGNGVTNRGNTVTCTGEHKRNYTKETIQKKKDMSNDISRQFKKFVEFYETTKGVKIKAISGRRRKFMVRLKTFTLDEILMAASNILNDPFLQGDNDRGKAYGDIDFILRNDETIEKWSSSTRQVVHEELNACEIEL